MTKCFRQGECGCWFACTASMARLQDDLILKNNQYLGLSKKMDTYLNAARLDTFNFNISQTSHV